MRNLAFGQKITRVIVTPLIAASLMFGCKKPAEEKVIHPVVAALASTVTCVSASPDNKLVVVEHRTSATGGYMFLNGQTIEATPETGTPNIRVSISPDNSPGAQGRFRVSYQDESGKTGSAEATVPECSR